MPLPLDIVILAAGKGTRMHSDRPKVLHELAGKPLLLHVVDTAKSLDPAHICVVYGHGGEALPQAIADPSLRMVLQEPQMGTGHALQQALPCLDPDHVTLVLYGDVPLIRAETLLPLFQMALPGKLALLTMEMADPHGYGRIVRENGKVARIVEQKDASAQESEIREINTGILAAPTRLLPAWLASLKNQNAQKEFYLTDIVALAVQNGIEVVTARPGDHREVLGVNSKSQLARLERELQHELAQGLLEAGVTLLDPRRIDVRGRLECGRDVVIDVNCVFEGHVRLGDGVKVGANCVLRDVTVEAGARIEPFCHLEQARIGAACRIGPFARIRPGTSLGDEVHVGNFVELKNSQVGFKSKINHLSYVGDSSVGAKVNIGAGTITCNYDGVNKHRTEIGDGAFIGSNTQLVAPVRVGRNATIGAGSIITKDAPEGELTLSRARQTTVAGWKRPVKKVGE